MESLDAKKGKPGSEMELAEFKPDGADMEQLERRDAVIRDVVMHAIEFNLCPPKAAPPVPDECSRCSAAGVITDRRKDCWWAHVGQSLVADHLYDRGRPVCEGVLVDTDSD